MKLENKAKMLSYAALSLVTFGLGFSLGHSRLNHQASQKEYKQETVAQTTKITTSSPLKQEEVEEFLLAYFTKKEIGENRSRYEPFMTKTCYDKVVAEENNPTNQSYKGLVVDSKFQNAKVFIDSSDLQVIAQVNYVNTQLIAPKNYEKAQKDIPTMTTVLLSYKQEDGELKVNQIETLLLVNPNQYEQTNEVR